MIFTPEKLTAIKAVAIQFGYNELASNPGIFMNDNNIVINTLVKTGISGYTGLPMIGKYDVGETDENDNSPVIEQVREAIACAFKKLPKIKPKTESKSFGWKEPDEPKNVPAPESKKADHLITETVQEVKHDEDKTTKAQDISPPATKSPEPKQAKPIEPKTVKTKNCEHCGVELSHKRALECFELQPDEPVFCCEECDKPVPKQADVMPPDPKQNNSNQPSRIPVRTCVPKGSIIKGFMPSLAEIGKIKIGKKGDPKETTTGKSFRLPTKLDHFEIVSIIRDDQTGDFIPDPVMELLGQKPTELDIMLLFNDPSLNFVTSYNWYQGGKCLCRGDGSIATDANGNEIDCDPETCQQFSQKKCKPNGILSVILAKSPRLGGVYKFRTTSINSIKSILSSMFFLSTQTGGVLSMIPLKMTLSPKQVTPANMMKPVTIYVVNIEYAGTAADLLQKTFEVQKYQSAMRENIIKLEATARKVLTVPESPEEQKDVNDEWYPGQV